MDERQQLEDAILALEAQRAVLGDVAVDAALDGLRQKLAQLQSAERQARSPAVKLPGERRFVTILFCDVTGSTALAEKMDPEEWTEIMNAIFDYLIEPVERYEGTVARLMGDGILAFFGAPRAHEDDPQRAILAGLAILENMQLVRERLQREKGLTFDVRVGINTGLAVVGDVGSETAGEYTAMGSAVNLAARMEQTADPGTVQVSQETYRLAAPLFEWQALGPVQVKGKAEAVHTYRPLSLKKRPGPLRGLASHGISSSMVGRELELEQLGHTLRRLENGQGALVSVIGEAGLGKSRLVAEFRGLALEGQERSLRWLESRAPSYGGSSAYYAWRQIISQSIATDESVPALTVQQRLQAACMRIGFPVEMIPFLEVLLAVERKEDSSSTAVPEGEALAHHIRDACAEYIRRLSGEAATILVFDDLHWGDSASLELLANLCELVSDLPLLILALYRPDQTAESWHFRQVAGQKLGRSHIEITLQALPKQSSHLLLENLLADQDLPPQLVEAIFQKSEGNPFFIEEVIRMLLDRGVLQAASEERENARTLANMVGEIEIPGSLQALLVARIDRLEAEARRTLQTASVLGRSFYFRVLQLMAGAVNSLEQSVSALERADLIRREAQLPEPAYAFRHALIQEAAYATILLRERRTLHRRAADAIALLFKEAQEDLAPVLAAHYDRAGVSNKALHFYIIAGDSAFKLFANADAAVQYDHAVNVLNREPGSSEALSIETMRRLYLNRGRALELSQRFDEAIQNYEELHTIGESQDAPELALAALIALAVVTGTTGPAYDPQLSEQSVQRALKLSRHLGDKESEAKALWALFLQGWRIGWGQEVIAFGERSLALSQELGMQEQIALTSSDLAMAYASVGDLDKARSVLKEAISLWRQLGNVPMLANSLNISNMMHMIFGDYAALLAAAVEAYEISKPIGNLWSQLSGAFGAGSAYLEKAGFSNALVWMKESVTLANEGKLSFQESISRAYLSWTYSLLGNRAVALAEARAANILSESGAGEVQRWIKAILALVFIEQGELDSADRCLEVCLLGFEPSNLSTPAPIFVLLAMAQGSFVRGDHAQCLTALDELLHLQSQYHLEHFIADALALKAEVLLAAGDTAAAAHLLEQARTKAEALEVRRILWQILTLQAQLAARQDGLQKAREFHTEARRLVEAISADIFPVDLRQMFLNKTSVRTILAT